jgi:membrane dipeptidase
MTKMNRSSLHASATVIDAVCPLASDPQYLDWYRAGGVTALAPTIGSTESARETLNSLAHWCQLLHERQDLQLIRRARDVEDAKAHGRLGIYFHFQGTDPIEDNLDLIDLYKALGVGVIQLAYNVKNRVGDGCEERTDAGLSRYGQRVVARMNKAGVIVDCSHTGHRTALDAVECSDKPVVLSHSNVADVHRTPRNVSNDLIEAIARSGGVVGVVGFPGMISSSPKPSMDQLIDHIDAIVERVGVDHVGLGLDYYSKQVGVASDEDARASYEEAVRVGIWSTAYPPPPHYYPSGIETPRDLPNLTLRLQERGYPDESVRKILGGNWLRVMRAVWG